MFPTSNPETLKAAAAHLSEHDTTLGSVITRAGVATIAPHGNYYESLVGSIVSQQLSVKAADTIFKRFVALFPGDVFPTPEEILTKDIEELRAVGLSRQKGNYIQDLALKVVDGTVKFDHLDALSNDEIVVELTQIKGVGTWTVHMFLMFCMGRMDVLPIGDLGIKNGVAALYGFEQTPTPDDITKVAHDNHWHPYESVASWYVWHSLDNKPAL